VGHAPSAERHAPNVVCRAPNVVRRAPREKKYLTSCAQSNIPLRAPVRRAPCASFLVATKIPSKLLQLGREEPPPDPNLFCNEFSSGIFFNLFAIKSSVQHSCGVLGLYRGGGGSQGRGFFLQRGFVFITPPTPKKKTRFLSGKTNILFYQQENFYQNKKTLLFRQQGLLLFFCFFERKCL
jgi:hypothetical protein